MNKKQMMVLTTTRQKARAGNADAQLRMGRLYARGEIVEADPVSAYVWLTRAAEQQAEPASSERDAIAAILSPAELDQAKQRLADPVATSVRQAAGLKIEPLDGAAFGAAIHGLDPGAITDSQKNSIWEAYKAAHGLLCFPFDQLLERHELHALTAVFGENEVAPGIVNGIGKRALPGEEGLTVEEQLDAVRARGEDPLISYIGNLDPSTLRRQAADPNFFGEWEWHTDMSYIDVPPTFSLLHARRIPDDGGDTGFCSQVMAARHLPDDLRRRIAGRRLKHDSTYSSDGTLRPGMVPPASPIEAEGSTHPILRIVPSTGEEALFLGRRTNAYVVGLPLGESEQLVDELWAHATQDAFCYRHKWRKGEVVVWDNRMLLHKRYPMDDTLERFMWRTQTKGEAVVAAA